MDKKPFFISTAIAYVNAKPHVGFALECVMADAIARYMRMMGRETFFSTGTDEHGSKIYKTAKDQGIDTKEFCDNNAKSFMELMQLLNISNTDFIRTSDKKRHWPSVEKLWNKLVESGDIYKKSYSGLYCEGCETFVLEKDLINGRCQHHANRELVRIEEENYFFKLSKYSDEILRKIESRELEILPSFRENEIIAMLKDDGLKDVSFSRPIKTLPWGVPVPGDDTQNMYVWSDALTNYISILDYANEGDNYKKFWLGGEKVHVIGKDIVRFHAGIWIGMLISAKIPTPNKIVIHGFMTAEGQKMSKSLGNVVDPFEEVKKYGVDASRYFFLSQVPVGHDYDFSRKIFENIYNAHLANNLGNYVNRVSVLSEKNSITPDLIPNITSKNKEEFEKEVKAVWSEVDKEMGEFNIHKAMERIWKFLDFLNKKMDEHKPWLIAKESPEKLKEIMPLFLEATRQLSYLLDSFIPATAEKIRNILGVANATTLEEKQTWYGQKNWKKLGEKQILFPRLETGEK